jgi:hypothetical protein
MPSPTHGSGQRCEGDEEGIDWWVFPVTLQITHQLIAATYRSLPLQGKGYFLDDRRGRQQGHGTLALPGKYC